MRLREFSQTDFVTVNSELNPKLWQGGRLDGKVRLKLLQIARAFVDFVGIDLDVKDYTITGSNANYTWSKYSDLDLHVIIEGEVDISVDNKFLDTTGTGGIVGEMALIDSRPRSATAIAKTECKLVPIDQKQFTFLVQQTPNFAINVMKIMVERIRKLDALVLANQ